MDVIKFTETVFSNKNKKGILTPDSDGYYTVIVGGLNSYNSAGEYYVADGVIDLFAASSHFQRRIKSGALYAELGHPKKLPGMSLDSFYNRIISLDDSNICGHFSEVSLDFDFGKKNPDLNNPSLIAIIAKVKPAGNKANVLQLALENPKQNAAFSIRGLTKNYEKNNRVERRLTNIITFDHVTEPGISIADKYMAPGLESRISTETYSIRETTDTLINVSTLNRVINTNMAHIGLESSNRELFNDILGSINKVETKPNRLASW